MSSSRKKVIVRQYDGPIVWGYASSDGFVTDDAVEILDPAAKLIFIALKKIKHIAYVRDFNLDDPDDPERMGKRMFSGRPRGEGLWVRLEFQNQEILEGLTHFDLTFLHDLEVNKGVLITVPDTKSNTLKVFAPTSSLASIQVLGWVTSPSKQKVAKRLSSDDQPLLFEP
jgi:hypothetical protein